MTGNASHRHTTFQGINRRGALNAGLLGLGGLSLPAFLRQQADAGETPAGDTAVIFLFLHGGPSQLETYDMKPAATREVRGPFHPISTSVADLQLCELLPLHAQIADRFTLIRSCTHGDGGHFEAHGRFMSGNPGLKPGTFESTHPQMGAIVGRALKSRVRSEPATQERTRPTGDVARVPEFDPTRYLIHTDFSGDEPLKPITAPSRPKGWRAEPLLASSASDFGVAVLSNLDDPTATIGFNLKAGTEQQIQPAAKAYLAQEIRSPRPGSFVFRARLRAEASSPEFFRDVFLKNFRCRLVLFQFTAPTKVVNESREMASIDFEPKLVASGSKEWQTVELPKGFLAPPPGAGVLNFGSGLGVSIQVMRSTDGPLTIPAGHRALLRIADAKLNFVGKERNDNVTV